jgi:2-iminobutanoate/2-iminopropanoate deaminase
MMPEAIRLATPDVPPVVGEAASQIREAVRDLAPTTERGPPMAEIISTPEAPGNAAYGKFPYSQAVKAGGLVFVSGQGPFDPATGAIVGDTIQDQTRQALTNCQAILRAAGSSMARVVQATFILRDPADFGGMNEEWQRWFETDPPARQGAKLPLEVEGLRISIAVIAEA